MSRLPLKDYQTRWAAIHKCGSKAAAARALKMTPHTLTQWCRNNPFGRRELEEEAQTKAILEIQRLAEEFPDPPKPRVTVSVQYDRVERRRLVAIGDAHDSPKLPDKSRFLWMGRFVQDVGADTVIQIGDFFTFDSLCKYEDNATLKGQQKPKFLEDIDSGNEALRAFERGLAGHTPAKHVTLGNHEDRAISFTNRTPEMAGVLTGLIDNLFMSHRWTYSPYGLIHYIGGVGFVHVPLNRLGKPYGGKTALSRIANDCLHDLVWGHDHLGGKYRSQKIGHNQWLTMLNLGCALPEGYVEPYVGHGMSGWEYGIYLLDIDHGKIESAKHVSMRELEEQFRD